MLFEKYLHIPRKLSEFTPGQKICNCSPGSGFRNEGGQRLHKPPCKWQEKISKPIAPDGSVMQNRLLFYKIKMH